MKTDFDYAQSDNRNFIILLLLTNVLLADGIKKIFLLIMIVELNLPHPYPPQGEGVNPIKSLAYPPHLGKGWGGVDLID